MLCVSADSLYMCLPPVFLLARMQCDTPLSQERVAGRHTNRPCVVCMCAKLDDDRDDDHADSDDTHGDDVGT